MRRRAIHVGILVDVSTRLGRVEVGLAFLQVFYLAGGVLGSREAAMQTSHFCTLAITVNKARFDEADKRALEGESVSWNSAKARRISGFACPV